MAKIETQTVEHNIDVLVIGGGIAGLTAAVSAKEKNPDADIYYTCYRKDLKKYE